MLRLKHRFQSKLRSWLYILAMLALGLMFLIAWLSIESNGFTRLKSGNLSFASQAALFQPSEPSPLPQTPQSVGSQYNDQMTSAAVLAECEAGSQRLEAEYKRVLADLELYKASHPSYYETELESLTGWLQQGNVSHSEQCQAQLALAQARELLSQPPPPSQTLREFQASFDDSMTLEQVENECLAVNQLIEAEHKYLLVNIRQFQISHPEYYELEFEQITDWYSVHFAKHANECAIQAEAARRRAIDQPDLEPPPDEFYQSVPQAVKDLANELQLTDAAKRVLYGNDPRILNNENHPDFNCREDSVTEVYIYGCWSTAGTIRILKDNSTATTLAHELLHAVYHDLYINGRADDINQQIDLVVLNYPDPTRVILDAYAKQLFYLSPEGRHYLRYSELHSFIGTQFQNIPQVLEEHYGQYFKQRQVVLDVFYEWVVDTRAKIKQRQVYYQRLLYQATEYHRCLSDINVELSACRFYQPDEASYTAYDICLESNKTFLHNCQDLRPVEVIAYEPAPPPAIPEPEPPPTDTPELDDQQAVQELIARVNQKQTEAEDSFIQQLTAQDYEFEAPEPVPEDETPVLNTAEADIPVEAKTKKMAAKHSATDGQNDDDQAASVPVGGRSNLDLSHEKIPTTLEVTILISSVIIVGLITALVVIKQRNGQPKVKPAKPASKDQR